MSYAALAGVFVAIAGGIGLTAAAARRGRPRLRVLVAVAGVLLILTAVFDSVMIAADLFRFEESALAGPRIWLAPVEDFAWPVAATLMLPALWEWLGSRSRPA